MLYKILSLPLILLGLIHETQSFCEAKWTSNISSEYSSSPGLSEPGNAVSSLIFTVFGIGGLCLRDHSDMWYINMNLYTWMGITSFLHHYFFYDSNWAMYSDVVTMQILAPMALYQIISVIKETYWGLYVFSGMIIAMLSLISMTVMYLLGAGPRHEILYSLVGCIVFSQIPTIMYFFREKREQKWDIFKALLFAGGLFGTSVALWYIDDECPHWMRNIINGHALWHVGIAWSLFTTLNVSNIISITLRDKEYRWITPFPSAKWVLFAIKVVKSDNLSEIKTLVHKPIIKKTYHRRASSWT